MGPIGIPPPPSADGRSQREKGGTVRSRLRQNGVMRKGRGFAVPGVGTVVAVLWASVTGCQSVPSVGESAPPPAEVHTLLLVPMNFDTTPTTTLLARGVDTVQRAVADYLQNDLHRSVEELRLVEVLQHWRLVLKEGGLMEADPKAMSREQIEGLRSALACRLAEAHPADVVLMPTLLIREGTYQGIRLRWDGVTRPVPLRSEHGALMMVQRIGGKGMGTSLRVSLFTPDGRRFFERYVGLEPVWRYAMTGFAGSGGSIRGYPRDDLFQDAELIQEVVQMAFVPFLEPSEESD
jgi:hypothetical protein